MDVSFGRSADDAEPHGTRADADGVTERGEAAVTRGRLGAQALGIEPR